MRLWSLHPRLLDAKGLVALWREGLLARAVLRGRTRGYRAHPQLHRFREQPRPVASLDAYLRVVLVEARARGYRFDAQRVGRPSAGAARVPVTAGQLRFEWRHLRTKLRERDPRRLAALRVADLSPHPLFRVVPGPVASWERGGASTRRASRLSSA